MISIITVCLNSEETIERCISSVDEQNYGNIEHIIIDGASTDGTLEKISKAKGRCKILITEPDEGVYDALNKGFKIASGDVLGILHSDDVFFNKDIVSNVMKVFLEHEVEMVYGDIEMLSSDGVLRRTWVVGDLGNKKIINQQIPHPSIFLRKSALEKLDPFFDSSYQIAADLKQQLILINMLGISRYYLNKTLIKMTIGGKSTKNLKAVLEGWIESRRAWNEVHGRGGAIYVASKVIRKLSQFKTIKEVVAS